MTLLNHECLNNNQQTISNINKREEYISDILKLINSLINESKQVHERIRIRYEFIGLKLMDFFKNIE